MFAEALILICLLAPDDLFDSADLLTIWRAFSSREAFSLKVLESSLLTRKRFLLIRLLSYPPWVKKLTLKLLFSVRPREAFLCGRFARADLS